ncbi:hypothetical protein [Burkholderia cenocepacia]|uniref:hypothetical protein n=1 Tax=Burkholderia cenocepacia TaxID=95486 RepID=UPI00223719B6|nr:hypothetical protein [Burkholderia cenocepacia]MCW5141062.1 hypothetical protein [Burkholderia cenocepacia]
MKKPIPLIIGAYQAQSIIASAQRCVNLYVEKNPPDSPFPTTHYPTPGLRKLADGPGGGAQGAFVASTDDLYFAAGGQLYRLNADFSYERLGNLASATRRMEMTDNGQHLVVVDGSPNGYTVDLKTREFAAMGGAGWYGSDRVDVMSGYLIFNRPETNQFYASSPFGLQLDPLDFAGKVSSMDRLVACAVANPNLWLFGERTSEIWRLSGAQDFAFAKFPGANVQHGCAAPHSIAVIDSTVYWLAQNDQGGGIVMRTENVQATRASTHAIEQEIQTYPRIDDAFGFAEQFNGHTFYVLNFPSADKTWAFDLATKEWHERGFLDRRGALRQHRAGAVAYWKGRHIAFDRDTGDIYESRPDVYDDAGSPILRVRGFPHMVEGGNRVVYRQFIADMAVGRTPAQLVDEPRLRLRWSDTRGESWGNPIMLGLGRIGEFRRSLQFNRLGIARDRVFELSWSAPVRTALNGAFVDTEPAAS